MTDLKPYTDPLLRIKKTLLQLVDRMAAGGMITSTYHCKGEVALSTVVKKLITEPNGQPRRSSRLVVDERQENTKWRQPPRRSLGAGAALGNVDASKEAASGYKLRAAVGDIPDYYYCLIPPLKVAQHSVIAGIAPAEVAAEMGAQGIPVTFGRSLPFAAAQALVVGFRRAVYRAQICPGDGLQGSGG